MEDGSSRSSLLIFPNEPSQGEGEGEDEEGREERGDIWSGDAIKDIVDAALDAVVTSFSLISSISAAHLSSGDVLVLGFAKLVADAISQGLGEFMATGTEKDMAESEKTAIEHDIVHRTKPEKSEMSNAYRSLGMDSEDAETVVRVFSKYKDIMVDEKMATQRGLLPPRETENQWKSGLIAFATFMVFGSLPLLSFTVLIPFKYNDSVKFLVASVLSVVSLSLLGFAKASISREKYLKSIAATLFNGCIAAACAYLVGWMLSNVQQ